MQQSILQRCFKIRKFDFLTILKNNPLYFVHIQRELFTTMEFEVAIFDERKVNDVCRTCLTKDAQMSSVFQRFENDLSNVNEFIMQFCSVQIKPDDGLSELICRPCLIQVKNALSFKKKCEDANRTMKNHKMCDQKDEISMVVKEESNHSSFSEQSHKSNDENKRCTERNRTSKRRKRNSMDTVFTNPSLLLHDFNIGRIKDEDWCKEDPKNLIQKTDFKHLKRKVKHKPDNQSSKSNINFLGSKSGKKIIRRNKISTIRFCDFCDFKSKLPSQMTKHMHTHTGEKPLSCDLCDFRCIQKSSLYNHSFVHGNEKPYPCTLCDYKSTNSSNLKRHMLKHTGDKPYSCDLCSYRCVRSSYLEEHKRTHTGEKPFLCDQCHYRCTTNSCLKIHKRNKHQTQKRYACNECDFKAKSRSTLISHIRIHTGDRRFVCDQCPYRAIQLATLNNHKMMVHTGERPFACEQCPYRGISSGHLKVHMQCHQTVKNFSCEECGYMCHTSYKLKTHRRTHTGEKPYLCAACDFKSSSPSSLKRHHKKNHTLICTKTIL